MPPFAPTFISGFDAYSKLQILMGPADFLWATMTRPILYGWYHILCLALVAIACIFIVVKRNTLTERAVWRTLLAFWLVVVVFEIVKQINFSYSPTSGDWTYQWYAFPFQFCSSIIYVLPLAVFIKNETFRSFMYSFLATYNLFAGIAVMLYPSTVFIDVTYINIQTMVHHGLMVIVGVLMYATGMVKFNFKTIAKAVAVFAGLLAVAFALNKVFDDKSGFNMFFIDIEGCELPVLNIISQNAPYPVFLLCYIIGFTICAAIILGLAKLVSLAIEKIEKKTAKKAETC